MTIYNACAQIFGLIILAVGARSKEEIKMSLDVFGGVHILYLFATVIPSVAGLFFCKEICKKREISKDYS
jgi:hypothetical protein